MDDSTQASVLGRLTISQPGLPQQVFILERFPALIGRSGECEVCLELAPGQTTVSRHHARLSLGAGGLRLEDLSSNGSSVGGQMLKPGELRWLSDREEVMLGPQVRMLVETFRIGHQTSATEVAPALSSVQLRLKSLGTFEACWDQVPVASSAWETRKPILLLAYLAWQIRPVAPEKVCQDLWPDHPQGGRQALQSSLARLRRALKPREPVLFERGYYRMNPRWDTFLDAHHLMELWRQSRSLQDASLKIPLLEQVHQFYAGPFLEGYGEDWACLRRRELEQNYLQAMEEFGQLLLDRGQQQQADQLYGRVFEVQPCWEPGHLGRMRLLLDSGQRDEAIRHYHRYVETLRSRLSLSPSPEMLGLYLQLLQN